MQKHGIRAKARDGSSHHRLPHGLPVADTSSIATSTRTAPNTTWSADITYIPTTDGWLYLAVVEDLLAAGS